MLESLPTLEIHQKIVSHLRVTCPVILDIGCNDGSDTQRFLELCPDASVYCFEPDPRAIARFKENKRLARPNVALMQLAISDRNGTIEFHPSNGDGDARGGTYRAPYVDPKITFQNMIGFALMTRFWSRPSDWMTGAAKLVSAALLI